MSTFMVRAGSWWRTYTAWNCGRSSARARNVRPDRYVIRYGLQWKDVPLGHGPPKTLYNRFIRWSRLGVFARVSAALAARGGAPERLMIDVTHLKAHRTAASLLRKGVLDISAAPRRPELQAARRL